MTAALELDGLEAGFGRAAGLRPVSLAIAPGERVVLLGPSGAGKTSLLRAIAGLAPARAGRVRVAGADVTALPPERRGVVYLHQAPLLFPHLSVRDNVAFPLAARGVDPAARRAAADAALATVRLGALAGRPPATLSGGERQRAALARAMVGRPAVLLLDEPLTGLDPALRDELREHLLALHSVYAPALLLVTHDLADAGALADRIGVIDGGGLEQLDTPARLFAAPAGPAVARLLGYAGPVRGRIAAGRFESALGPLPAPAGVPDGAAVAYLRPGALRVAPDGPIAAVVRRRVHGPAGPGLVVTLLGQESVPADGDAEPGAAVRLAAEPGRVAVYRAG